MTALAAARDLGDFTRCVRLAITTATRSITPNVPVCRRSTTLNVKYGGMKKKSKASTLKIAVAIEARNPKRVDTRTMPRRYVITTSARLVRRNTSTATTVASAVTAPPAMYPAWFDGVGPSAPSGLFSRGFPSSPIVT